MLDRRCLVEVPNAPRHRAERAHAEADYDEETARDNYFNPPAGHRSGPGGPTDAQTPTCPVYCLALPPPRGGENKKIEKNAP